MSVVGGFIIYGAYSSAYAVRWTRLACAKGSAGLSCSVFNYLY